MKRPEHGRWHETMRGLAVLAAGLGAGLAGSAHAETYLVNCPVGGPCSTYNASGWRIVCYCGTESVPAVLSAVTMEELRRRFPAHAAFLDRSQGGPASLSFFSDEAAINRALDTGYRVETFQVSGRTATLRITFSR